MTIDDPQYSIPPEAPAPPAPVNPWGRIVGVFLSPVQTMKSIAERPDWVIPLIVLVVLGLMSVMVITPQIDLESQLRDQFTKAGMPESRIDDQIAMAQKVSKIFTPLTALLIPLWLTITAGALLIAFKAFESKARFAQAFSITAYSWMPLTVKGLITMALVLTRDMVTPFELQAIVPSNLAFLVNPKQHAALFSLAVSVDLFVIWSIFLLILGFSDASRFSRTKSATIIITLWAIYVLGKTGLAALQG
jgi:hypothetical protein